MNQFGTATGSSFCKISLFYQEGLVSTGYGIQGNAEAGGAAAETRQALANVLAVLDEAGVVARDVAQCSVFVADSADVDDVGAIYGEFFPVPPRRMAVAEASLSAGALVEIECTAVVPEVR